METTLYEADFPLFEGDFLLDEFSLAELPSGPQKNVKSGALQAPLSPEGDLKPAELFQNLTRGAEPAEQEDTAETPFQADWLDTKLDLFEFLQTDEQQIEEITPDESTDALTMLSNLGRPVIVEQLKTDNQTLMEALTSLTDALDVPVEIAPVKHTDGEFAQPFSPVSVDDIESLLSENQSPSNSAMSTAPSSPQHSSPSTSAMSTAPSSPQHSDHDDDTFNSILYELMTEGQTESTAGPAKKSKSRKKGPYGSAKKDYDKTLDRKQRKKQQNRDAALRYRSKKRSQQEILDSQAEELEEKNKTLRDKVDSISREIQYLKDLMAEVRKAKSQ